MKMFAIVRVLAAATVIFAAFLPGCTNLQRRFGQEEEEPFAPTLREVNGQRFQRVSRDYAYDRALGIDWYSPRSRVTYTRDQAEDAILELRKVQGRRWMLVSPEVAATLARHYGEASTALGLDTGGAFRYWLSTPEWLGAGESITFGESGPLAPQRAARTESHRLLAIAPRFGPPPAASQVFTEESGRSGSVGERLEKQKEELRIGELQFDPDSNTGFLSIQGDRVGDRQAIQQFISEVCLSKNQVLIAGQEPRAGAGYKVTRETAREGYYKMWFRCVY